MKNEEVYESSMDDKRIVLSGEEDDQGEFEDHEVSYESDSV
eukprot:CAMPEP_0116901926 /NCGR_PEP_ID=MMETSP0467-20121206/9680_1 /TAXON_ID=283647 /ORGANISM="Mesodinium pulex, Strain SPMC105" /LENGTH=40 /DNA_ID= /DNA_START= /DNA_END= /DNA_ORIENTATION=